MLLSDDAVLEDLAEVNVTVVAEVDTELLEVWLETVSGVDRLTEDVLKEPLFEGSDEVEVAGGIVGAVEG